jgi:acyl CoA:acetate/3-ketoacid CoA transferase alpha subunit
MRQREKRDIIVSPRQNCRNFAGFFDMPKFSASLEEALTPIGDGCVLVVPREVSGVPMEATRALIRRGVKGLHLVALPTSSLQADLLIGAGCVATLETSAVSLGEFGPAPRFSAAITAGSIRMLDATCPALHAALQAAVLRVRRRGTGRRLSLS